MKRIVAALLLAVSLLAAAHAEGDGYLEARRLVHEGKILPLERILADVEQLRTGQILEVEFDEKHGRRIYEIEILDDQGTVWELKVDAATGELLKQELED